jgi:subtilisin family serine protease
MFRVAFLASFVFCAFANAASTADYLVKVQGGLADKLGILESFETAKVDYEEFAPNWVRVQGKNNRAFKKMLSTLAATESVEFIQPNYPVRMGTDFTIQDPLRRAAMWIFLKRMNIDLKSAPPADNPEIPPAPAPSTGSDPQFAQQWGMKDIGVSNAWRRTRGNPEMLVAVIDTGVDYTHEDLLPNLWRNPGESGTDSNGRDKSSNGVDDDGNGFVDDITGWDFVSNDNKPYDLTTSINDVIFKGGNPGHGTHCAGNVAARSENGKGIAGVAPNVKIMSIRFLSDKGGGTTADAVKSILYAVNNGARILSNSWGSEGEDSEEGQQNKALRDSVKFAEDHGVLFIAAAGNGHSGRGYNNDTDPRPAFPASYDHDNIISVAALDAQNNLGSFSNWGATSVDLGAPGVNVFSTMVGNQYSNKVIDKEYLEVTWDGTSMATPHVAGAAALYWSLYPQKNWREVKDALLGSVTEIPSMQGKSVSNGKLNLDF